MSRTVERIVLTTPESVGSSGQYSALAQCRLLASQARADGSLAGTARTAAQESALVAQAARDQAVAAVGGVKVTATDTTASTLDGALQTAAPLAKAIQTPGGDEALLLSVAAMTAATAETAGAAGVVQAPTGANGKFLRGDATWQAIDKASVGLSSVTDDAQIAKSLGTAKGDIVAFGGPGVPVRVPVGTDGQVLMVDSGQAAGVKYATPSSGASPWGNEFYS